MGNELGVTVPRSCLTWAFDRFNDFQKAYAGGSMRIRFDCACISRILTMSFIIGSAVMRTDRARPRSLTIS